MATVRHDRNRAAVRDVPDVLHQAGSNGERSTARQADPVLPVSLENPTFSAPTSGRAEGSG